MAIKALEGLSPEEQMQHVWDVERVKQLMHKRAFFQTMDAREEELSTLWVTEEAHLKTASFGSNWGYYVGMDEVKRYYIEAHEAALTKQMAENGSAEKNLGNMYAHPLTTGLVEVAMDGKTAKGLWYTIGNEAMAQADGSAHVQWMLGKVAADFVKEKGEWKIWHIVNSVDVDCEAGHNYGEYPVYMDITADSWNPVRREFGNPTIEMLTHDVTFNWWDDYPSMPPKNYKTWSDEISYGPEGYKPPSVIGMRAGEGGNYK